MPRLRHLLALAVALALLIAPAASSASPDMVLSQLFAGGGNAGAPYANDFVELFNRGDTTVDLSGWSIQYASASGTTWQVTALSGSVQPGRRYLVQLASAAVGAALPTPDATGTSNLAVSGGKVALVRGSTALTCGASAGSPDHQQHDCGAASRRRLLRY
jgi:predicted extracellular nuclease